MFCYNDECEPCAVTKRVIKEVVEPAYPDLIVIYCDVNQSPEVLDIVEGVVPSIILNKGRTQLDIMKGVPVLRETGRIYVPYILKFLKKHLNNEEDICRVN